MASTLALTGGTGFIGGRIAQRLVGHGWRVRALIRQAQGSRRSPRALELEQLGVEWVTGSLDDQDSLKQLLDGADAMVHCAGAVRGASLEDFERVNVDGVRSVLRAAQTAGAARAPRLLCLSSLAAREPGLSHYAMSKYHGEQVLEAEAGDVEWIALRPPAVYGPGDKELLPLFRWMQRGVAPIVGDRDGRFSMLFVDDLAAAVEAWLTHGQGVTGVFALDDGQPGGYDWVAIVAEAARLRGAPVRMLPVPRMVLGLIARLSLMSARITGIAPMLSPGKVRELRHREWVCDNEMWRRKVPWEPQVRFREGLRRVLSA